MKKRYLPFGYAVRDGNIVVDIEQRTIVQNIFTAYLAGNTFQQIAESMISKGIEYHKNDADLLIKVKLPNKKNLLTNRCP